MRLSPLRLRSVLMDPHGSCRWQCVAVHDRNVRVQGGTAPSTQEELTLSVVICQLVLGVPPRVAGAVGVPHGDPLVPLLPDRLRAGRLAAGLGLLRETCITTPQLDISKVPCVFSRVMGTKWTRRPHILGLEELDWLISCWASVRRSLTRSRSGSCRASMQIMLTTQDRHADQ